MSVLRNNISSREIEGPGRLFKERVLRRTLEENPAIIGFVSMKEWLTVKYGKEGVGWAADSDRYTQSQNLVSSLGNPQADGLFETKPVSSALIDIILYPDGEVYHESKYVHTV